MREELFEEILSLVEEYINELDDETVERTQAEREKNFHAACKELAETPDNEDARKKAVEAKKKLDKNIELTGKRGLRKHVDNELFKTFKERLLNRKPQTPKQTQQAGSDHANAIIDQHLRNKLEKAFSNECFESLISLIEGELIDFQEKRKQKVLDRNAEKMARMMQDGSLNAVRVLPNHELIGDPVAIKMVKDIQKENDEVISKARKKA